MGPAPPPGGPVLLAERLVNATRLPHLPLGQWPTPLAAAPELAAALGLTAAPGRPALLIKDDGLGTAGYGGNKPRKLEYLLAEARHRDCDTVVTYGAAGSNHVLATALHARAHGLHCHAVLTPQPPTPWVADTLRWHLALGTTLHPATGFADSAAIAADIKARHPRGAAGVYDIPWGGSSPRGTLGFVAAGLELAAQCAASKTTPPRVLYLPLGTMGSAVGLAIGLAMSGLPTRVMGVVVVPPVVASTANLATLVDGTLTLLRTLGASVPAATGILQRLVLREGFFGAGYAMASPEARDAVARAARVGLALETTYAGKALAALMADGSAAGIGAAGADAVVPGPAVDAAAGPLLFWLTGNRQPRPPDLADQPVDTLPAGLRSYLDAGSG